MMNLQTGDFVYLDPPYIKVLVVVNYVSSGFSNEDSLFLLGFVKN